MRQPEDQVGSPKKRLRIGAVVGVVSSGLLIYPAVASASPPLQGTFASREVFLDADVCAPEGFPVDVIEDESGVYQVFFDKSGAVAFIEVHIDYRAVISANGHVIVERDRWTDTYYADGKSRTVGDTVHIDGEGPGLVQHDAGQIILAEDGSVVAIHGPHPQFLGQTFCFALLP